MQVKALSCKEEAKYCMNMIQSGKMLCGQTNQNLKIILENMYVAFCGLRKRGTKCDKELLSSKNLFFFSLNIWHVFCVLLKMKYYIYILHRPNTFFLGIPFAYWRKTLGLFVVLWQYRVHFEDKKNQPESDEFMRLWVTCVDNLLPWHFLLSYVDTSRCGPFLALSHAFQFGPSTHRKKFLTTQVHMPNVITRRFLPAL